ncbi:MAG: hypothetical protein JW884_04985 [Deltaproteobacteria bacterium]|nr:hypothetical protein [Deltaproteobacteria bacterium]
MKKWFLVFLAAAFVWLSAMPGVSAAADVRFNGTYYVTGYYDDNHTLKKDGSTSSAFFAQKLQIGATFKVQEGLDVTTRFNIHDRVWNGSRSSASPRARTGDTTSSENIDFDWSYVSFLTSVGKFDVGYQQGGNVWGCTFGNSEWARPRIKFTTKIGPWIFIALTEKEQEGDYGAGAVQADDDKDHYVLATVYVWDKGNAGLLWKGLFYENNTASFGGVPYLGFRQKYHVLSPYFKMNAGPLYLEGQVYYIFGQFLQYENESLAKLVNPTTSDIDISGWSAYLMAKYSAGPVYFGGLFGYVSGDDATTTDKYEGGVGGGEDWKPCLILFNDDLYQWTGMLGSGAIYGSLDSATITWKGNEFGNGFLYQVFAGVSPMEKLTINAAFTYAVADSQKIPINYAYIVNRNAYYTYGSSDYGTEFDITATYKIYDNLSYMVGFGYLWTGDWFKGSNPNAEVGNNYLFVNRLTATF